MSRLACCLVALIPACASNDAVTISDAEYDDVAVSIGSTTATGDGGGELGAMSDVIQLARGSGHAHLARLGVTYDYDVRCFDAGGREGACSAGTDAAEIHAGWTGRLDLPFIALALDRDGDWTLSGLASGTPTLDGDGHISTDSVIDDPERGTHTTYHLAYDATFTGVELAALPTGGTIDLAITAERTRKSQNQEDTRTFELSAAIRFLPSGHALLELDRLRRYDLDLASGAVVRKP